SRSSLQANWSMLVCRLSSAKYRATKRGRPPASDALLTIGSRTGVTFVARGVRHAGALVVVKWKMLSNAAKCAQSYTWEIPPRTRLRWLKSTVAANAVVWNPKTCESPAAEKGKEQCEASRPVAMRSMRAGDHSQSVRTATKNSRVGVRRP